MGGGWWTHVADAMLYTTFEICWSSVGLFSMKWKEKEKPENVLQIINKQATACDKPSFRNLLQKIMLQFFVFVQGSKINQQQFNTWTYNKSIDPLEREQKCATQFTTHHMRHSQIASNRAEKRTHRKKTKT